MIISDGTFWLLAFALYVIDHLKLIDNEEMVLEEDVSLQLVPKLRPVPFEIRKRCLILLNPLTPFTMAFKMTWEKDDKVFTSSVRKEWLAIKRTQRVILPFRVLASAAFLSLFIIGPLLTIKGGLAYALTLIGPVYLLLWVSGQILVAYRPLGLTRAEWLKFFAETAICPMYFPALLKRVSWGTALESNGLVFADRYCSGEELAIFQNAVAGRRPPIQIEDHHQD